MSSQHVACYPTESQYDRWKARADAIGYKTYSQFLQDMIEAGIKADKGFETAVDPDESPQQLRRQRNELKAELDQARDRIENLEEQAFLGERRAIRRYVRDNPGATTDEIIDYMERTASERTLRYLSMGSEIYGDTDANGQDAWYPTPDGATAEEGD